MADVTTQSTNASWFAALKGRVVLVHFYDNKQHPIPEEDEWFADSPHVQGMHGRGKTPAEAIADFNAKMVAP